MTQEQGMQPSPLDRALLALERLKAKVATTEQSKTEPVAIVGMGCRFPGGGGDPEAFWRMLENEVDAVREVPSDRWQVDSSQSGARWGGFLDAIDRFDAPFFEISPREAVRMDPQQRILLEVVWEALEHACQVPDRLVGSRTGVFVGVSAHDYEHLSSSGHYPLDIYSVTGNALSFIAGRISYILGLQGPCISIDTACSSSLVAAHLACQSLRNGESDMALAGGVNLILSPAASQMLVQALAPDGRCKAFDARANGFVRGEGCGIVVLKRLSDAQRDGDRIWALIRGSAVNQDGRSTGLTVPNVRSQESLIRQALDNARVLPAQVSYIEAHGTGTSLGDPIEVEALKAVLGQPRPDGSICALGSTKTNLGHLESAAGMAGLIKVVLSLQHETIPRHLHFESLNPMISLEGTPFVIPTSPLVWKSSISPRISGMSSFGMSGTNAHMILEEAPRSVEAVGVTKGSALPVLLPLSAKSPEALRTLAQAYRTYLTQEDVNAASLQDITYTASVRRNHHEHRLSVLGSSRAEVAEALGAFLEKTSHPGLVWGHGPSGERPRVVFVFSGQGSQWLGMGRQLLEQEPVFGEALKACDKAIRQHADFSMLEELLAPDQKSKLERIDVIQPTLFAMGVALAALWKSWGVHPDAVVGHSMGEVGAAYVAGALSLDDAAQIICRRSQLLKGVSGQGAMAVVELTVEEATERLRGYEDRISVAVSNSPRSTVLSGDASALDELIGKLEADQVFCRRVKVDVASHSPQMDPLREPLLRALSEVKPSRGQVPIYSTVSGRVSDGADFDAAYWVSNLREPVQFGRAVEQLVQVGHSLFIEMSPHPILLPAIEPMLRDRSNVGGGIAVGSLRREQSERSTLLQSLGMVYGWGYSIDWQKLYPSSGHCVPLPTYPWERQRYWVEGAPVQGASAPRLGARRALGEGHPLLGELFIAATQPGTRFWQTELRLEDVSYLSDHRVQEAVVLPGTAYVEMALSAARQVVRASKDVVVEEMAFRQALVLREAEAVILQVGLTEEEFGRWSLRISSRPVEEKDGSIPEWTLHASSIIRLDKSGESEVIVPNESLDAIRARCEAEISKEVHYRTLAEQGLFYGAAFQGVQELWHGTGEAVGRLRLSEEMVQHAAAYELHPALLDSAFQVLAAALGASDTRTEAGPAVPVRLQRFRVYERPGAEVWSHVRVRTELGRETGKVGGDVVLLDGSGRILVEALGLVAQRLETTTKKRRLDESDAFLALDWQPAEALPEFASVRSDVRGRWLILADDGGLAETVQSLLEARGEEVVSVSIGDENQSEGHGRYRVDPASPEAFDTVLLDAFKDGAPRRGIIHLWSLDAASVEEDTTALLNDIHVRVCGSVLHLVQALARTQWRDSPRLWLITRGVHAVNGELSKIAIAQAPLWGMGRTIAYEHPELHCTRIDLAAGGLADEAIALVRELVSEHQEEEIALRSSSRYLSRLVRRNINMTACDVMRPAREQPFRLEIDEPGILDKLILRATQRRPPGPGEIEIQVEAAGLNFLDVLLALGAVPSDEAGGDSKSIAMGGECTGRIVTVGQGVQDLHPGQFVMAMAPGAFGSFVTVPARFVLPRPVHMSPEEAASLLITHLTSYYALAHIARLSRGERILIHAAAGGVGLAAIQWARHVGAEIFATAGSLEKQEYLRSIGIRYVTDSRSLRFVDDIQSWTQGEGVDVVLNSLTGEFIPKSLELLRDHGRFIELGKRDYFSNAQIGLRPFLKNLSFSLVDLRSMSRKRPEHVRTLFEEVGKLFQEQILTALPHRVFKISAVHDAFKYMAQGQHIGKIVLSFNDPNVRIASPPDGVSQIRDDGTYLISGGLGGLGLSLAHWMVARGARHLVLLGRHGVTTPTQIDAVALLRSTGVEVVVAQADVADEARLADVLRGIEKQLPPLRGVVHAAAVLDDGILIQQDLTRFRSVMVPKVTGALNLHRLTRNSTLDFFVLYSSAASLLGSPGQGNYVAANAFLDALAHYRKALGLPALSINWGAFSEIGLAAAQEKKGARISNRGMRGITSEEGNTILGRLLNGDVTQIGVVPIDFRQWVEFYPQAASSSRLSQLLQESRRSMRSKTGRTALRDSLRTAAPMAQRDLLEHFIREQVAEVLRMDVSRIERQTTLKSLGIDSLMGLELRNRLEVGLDLTLPATLVWTYPNLASLSGYLWDVIGLASMPKGEERPRSQIAKEQSPSQQPRTVLADSDIPSLHRQLIEQSVELEQMHSKLKKLELSKVEPIAIVGMGCHFPGGATTPDAFWNILNAGMDAIREVPAGRWRADDWPDQSSMRWGGFLDNIDLFDAQFFEIAPREAMSLDPQQRILLEVTWEALEHAGQAPDQLKGSRTGLFVGINNLDYQQQVIDAGLDKMDLYATTGNLMSTAAGRVSYGLDLRGPCVVIETACSSSLVSLHLACQSLRDGESDMALAGGVNIILSPIFMYMATQLQALAPDGRCKTFDARANGFVRGEGCGVVVLKRLSDAERDGDRIWAMIRGSAINHDGHSAGLTAPNVRSQQSLLQQALDNARVSPTEVSYIEAHGTGTPLGDPIEVEALRAVFGQPRPDGSICALGSVKTNLGHLEAAAGIAGLIKVVLSLNHELIPRHLHFQTLNPMINFEGTPFVIPVKDLPWKSNGSRRIAGVSSFGISGTNAHVIVEEAPQKAEAVGVATENALPVLLPLSAKSPEALRALAQAYQACLRQEDVNAVSVQDITYTASVRRSHYEHRLSVLGSSRAEVAEALGAFLDKTAHPGLAWGHAPSGERPRLVFVFPGQGSQWLGMGRQLLKQEPVFGEALKACDKAIRQHADFSVLEELLASEETSQLDRIDIVQPTLFAMGVALAALWKSWGVQPDAVVGHSMGEVGASYIAGALSLEDAAQIICRRSQLLKRVSGQGSMAVVELTVEEATERLRGYEDRVSVAVSNSPRSTVLSGNTNALDELLEKLESEQIFCRRVKVDVASHSPQMDPLREPLLRALSDVKPRRGQVPIYSTVSGQISDGAEFDAVYWVKNLREPVQFGRAVEQLVKAGHRLFVEISPHPILLPVIEPMLRDRAGASGGVAVGSLRREQGERAMLLQSLGTVYSQGYSIEWNKMYASPGCCVPLPTYPWERQRYWIEGNSAQGASVPRLGARRSPREGHPLLGELFIPAIQPGTRFWQMELKLEEVPYLSDHRVQEAVVLPGSAYVEMALSAARQALGASRGVVVEDVAFQQALVLREAETVVLQVALTEEEPGRWSLRISSHPIEKNNKSKIEWALHASCVIRSEQTDGSEAVALSESLDTIRARCGTEIVPTAYYQELSGQGLIYGPAFQGVQQLWQGTREAVGRLRMSEEVAQQAGAYELHPALLDAAFQVLGAAVSEQLRAEMGPMVPVRLGRLRVHQHPGSEVWSHVRVRLGAEAQLDELECDVILLDALGKVLVEALGLRVQRLEQRAARKDRTEENDAFLAPTWELAQWLPEPAAPPRGRWLLLGDETGVADAVQSLLEARGESVFLVAAAGVKEASTAGVYRVNPASPEDFDLALQEASRDGVPCRGVIHLWSLDLPSDDEFQLKSMEAVRVRGCGSALHLVQALGRTGWRDMPRLWLITRGTQAVGLDSTPLAIAQAPLWGLGRTIAYEHPEMQCTRLDLAPKGFVEEANALVRELLSESHEEEIAFLPEGRYVGRLERRSIGEMRSEIRAPAGDRTFRLEIDEPGRLDRLILRVNQRRQPGIGEIEIQVKAASLNFIDVMKVLGIYPGLPEGLVPLGGECSGTVVSLGEGVQGLHIGQDVVAMAPFCFGTHITTSTQLVVPRPKAINVEEAAALPSVFMTAWYALYYLGRLQKGDRILIHSAAGGVGLAAVQLARWVGAEIFATAGTPEKRAYLRELGIEHVMDSRSVQFAEQVMAKTRGKGIDVVLNSLSGQAIEKSMAILAKDGRFLELGKRDIYTEHRSLSMAFFRKRLSYHAVDLLGFAEDQPERFSALLREVLEAFEQGHLQPLPVQIFPISEAEKAFRLMAQGHHIGKLVMRLDDPNARIAVPAEETGLLRADGNYLITGGLGGLGLSVAQWMVEQGARHVALIGRRGPTDAQRRVIEALESVGAEVQVLQVDISDPKQLEGAMRTIEERAPLRGVIHAAAVLEDGLLMQQDLERLQKVMAPKVEGALNLHRLTRDKMLDFFVLYSSGASLLGSPGQGNYAAANTFLDALAHHRRAQDLPALSINWGPFTEVGLAAAQENRGVRLSNRGIRSFTPEEGVAILSRLLRSDVVQIAPVMIDMHQWVVFYPQASSSPRLSHIVAESTRTRRSKSGSIDLGGRLRATAPGERKAVLEEFIQGQVAEVLRMDASRIERQTPFKSFGIDSLMGLELRNRLEGALDLTLSATLIWTYPNVASLAEYLGKKLHIFSDEDAVSPSAQAPAVPEEDERQVTASLEGLSEEEKTALLAKEIADLKEFLS